MDGVNRLWKSTRLVRGAYTIRVVGEEQLRIAAAGLTSATRHPVQYLSLLAADPSTTGPVARLVRRAQEIENDATWLGRITGGVADPVVDPVADAGAAVAGRVVPNPRLGVDVNGDAFDEAEELIESLGRGTQGTIEDDVVLQPGRWERLSPEDGTNYDRAWGEELVHAR